MIDFLKDITFVDSFIINALLAGIALALVVGPLGCVVVWRKMAYFGDTLAHSALLGVALAMAFALLPMLGVVIVGTLLAIILFWLEKQKNLSTDTLLGILSHSALALGLIAISLIQAQGYNLFMMRYLFGDLLSVNHNDLILIYDVVIIILVIFSQIYHSLLAICTNLELAQVDGVKTERIRFIFMLLLALVIAVALKVVGMLLISALLIIPSATARLVSRSPKQMIVIATLMAVASVMSGLFLSLKIDLPAGASIVLSSSIIFFITRVFATNKHA